MTGGKCPGGTCPGGTCPGGTCPGGGGGGVVLQLSPYRLYQSEFYCMRYQYSG